jgi:hypothetical protein
VHQKLHKTGGFTCIVSPLNILSSKAGDFIFVDVEKTRLIVPSGSESGGYWNIKSDYTFVRIQFLSRQKKFTKFLFYPCFFFYAMQSSIPFISPQLMERIPRPDIKAEEAESETYEDRDDVSAEESDEYMSAEDGNLTEEGEENPAKKETSNGTHDTSEGVGVLAKVEKANEVSADGSESKEEKNVSAGRKELEEDDGKSMKTLKKKSSSSKGTTPLVIYEIESFFWTLIWALTTTGEKSRWRCTELMYSRSFQESFDDMFLNDKEEYWSLCSKRRVFLYPFAFPPVLRHLALRWEMQMMSGMERPDPWVWMTMGWNLTLEDLLKRLLSVQRHAQTEADATGLHCDVLCALNYALLEMPKGNMP